MKHSALILLLVSCIAISGIALGFEANPLRQHNSEASASSNGSGPSATGQAASSNESKAQKESPPASNDRGRSRRVSRKLRLPTPSRSKPASHPKHVPKDVQRDRERSRSENLNRVHQSTATKPAIHAVNVAKTHSLPIRPVTGSAVDGRQFRPWRNTAAAPTVGGSTNARKNAQALNGTGATRRH